VGDTKDTPAVVADLDEDQCGTDLLDTGNGLQQAVRPSAGLHRSKQVSVTVAGDDA